MARFFIDRFAVENENRLPGATSSNVSETYCGAHRSKTSMRRYLLNHSPYFTRRQKIDLLFYPHSPIHAQAGSYRVCIATTEE